jgi:hypothetical protein
MLRRARRSLRHAKEALPILRPGYRESSAASVGEDSVQTLAQPQERARCRLIVLANRRCPAVAGSSPVFVWARVSVHVRLLGGCPVLGVMSDVRAVPGQCPRNGVLCALRTAGSSRLNRGHVSVLGCVGTRGVLA